MPHLFAQSDHMFVLCSPHFEKVKAALLSIWKFMAFTFFPLVEENRASFIASSSSTFIWFSHIYKVFSSLDYSPNVWTPLETAPHPVREASVWIIACGFKWEKVRLLQNLKFSIHQINSALDLVLNVISDWWFIFFLRHVICCRFTGCLHLCLHKMQAQSGGPI